jgi:hypothetical protein
MNRPGKGRSKNCVKWCKNSGKSNSAKQLLFQLDADELKKELVLTKIVLQKGQATVIPNVSGVLEKFWVWESSNFEPRTSS